MHTTHSPLGSFLSRPPRTRELKHQSWANLYQSHKSRPPRTRELKQQQARESVARIRSRPPRTRELKLLTHEVAGLVPVASPADA